MADVPAPSPLKEHRPGVWLGTSWLRFSGLTLQTRMVVMDTGEGLLLYSPSPATPDRSILAELRALGEPRWIVAPNEIHTVGVAAFQEAFPEALTTGCIGHPRRMKHLNFDTLLDVQSRQADAPWTRTGTLRFHVIGGNALLHEIAVLHVPTRTLVLTDAVECIHPRRHLAGRPPGRALTWLMKSMGFSYGRPVMSPEHYALCVDPRALESSLHTLMSWDFDSLLISHGSLLFGDDARAAVESSFTRTLAAARKRNRVGRALRRGISRWA